ncbi:ATP synthase subunit beta [Fusarium agapanthi]|uniref:ATP synthase subunit beta n=1 Tax=Fusarium agapanthi TaxID=1803897 RepID=A0A9P5EFY5_9HYPO|nr:ATP synthase subunit beta [Fusarium agapanthi]
MAFSGQFLVCASNSSTNPYDPVPRLPCIGAHEINLAKSRKHRSNLGAEDETAYKAHVTATKKAWSVKQKPDKVLKIAARLTLAEQFREEGQDVLLFINNIFRFTQAKLLKMDTLSPMLVYSQRPMDDEVEVRPEITPQTIDYTVEKSPV